MDSLASPVDLGAFVSDYMANGGGLGRIGKCRKSVLALALAGVTHEHLLKSSVRRRILTSGRRAPSSRPVRWSSCRRPLGPDSPLKNRQISPFPLSSYKAGERRGRGSPPPPLHLPAKRFYLELPAGAVRLETGAMFTQTGANACDDCFPQSGRDVLQDAGVVISLGDREEGVVSVLSPRQRAERADEPGSTRRVILKEDATKPLLLSCTNPDRGQAAPQ